MKTAMTSRLHRFDALDNFRDYGDYATAAGGRIAPGRLFRSAHHGRMSDADLERLAAFDIGTVVTSGGRSSAAASHRAAPPAGRAR